MTERIKRLEEVLDMLKETHCDPKSEESIERVQKELEKLKEIKEK